MTTVTVYIISSPVLAVAALATALIAAPASATPKDAGGEHKITICHVTNSATNPYVIIEVDVAAFDGEGKNDHAHHVSNDGRVDVPYDEVLGCVADDSGGGGDDDDLPNT